jgi:hypothetical protein
LAAVDARVTGNDAVAEKVPFVESERRRAVNREAIQLYERIRINECLDALARRPLAARVLPIDCICARRGQRFGTQASETLERSHPAAFARKVSAPFADT